MHANTFPHTDLLQRIMLIGLSTNQWPFTHLTVSISVQISQCRFPFLSFLVASVHLFILSIRKKKPLFLPPQARDDDGLGGKLPQHSFTQDTPRLVFKTNSDVLVRTKTIEHQIEFKLNGYCTNMFWCYLLLKVYNFQATSSWHVKRLFHIWPLM